MGQKGSTRAQIKVVLTGVKEGLSWIFVGLSGVKVGLTWVIKRQTGLKVFLTRVKVLNSFEHFFLQNHLVHYTLRKFQDFSVTQILR